MWHRNRLICIPGLDLNSPFLFQTFECAHRFHSSRYDFGLRSKFVPVVNFKRGNCLTIPLLAQTQFPFWISDQTFGRTSSFFHADFYHFCLLGWMLFTFAWASFAFVFQIGVLSGKNGSQYIFSQAEMSNVSPLFVFHRSVVSPKRRLKWIRKHQIVVLCRRQKKFRLDSQVGKGCKLFESNCDCVEEKDRKKFRKSPCCWVDEKSRPQEWITHKKSNVLVLFIYFALAMDNCFFLFDSVQKEKMTLDNTIIWDLM